MNRRGAVLIGVLISAFVDVLFDVLVGAFVDCHCGGGEAIGLLLRNDSGVVARSSSVFSRCDRYEYAALESVPRKVVVKILLKQIS